MGNRHNTGKLKRVNKFDRYQAILLIAVVFLLNKCSFINEINENEFRNSKKWTILVYMIADNDLDFSVEEDINEMEEGIDNSLMNVIVYVDRVVGSNPEYPVILEITNDTNKNVKSKIIWTNNEINSCDIEILQNFLNFGITNYPAINYGIIFWSHGTGWLPSNFKKIKLNSFGLDINPGTKSFDIIELQQTIKIRHWDFILFDACYMGDIEVAYQIRKDTDYIIFSQCEILQNSFPYYSILKCFNNTNNEEIFVNICKEYFNYYNTNKGIYRSATVSLIKTSMLDELAISYTNYIKKILNYKEKIDIINLASNVQKLEYKENNYSIKYDFLDWIIKINSICSNLSNNSENLRNAFYNAVIYSTNTEKFFNVLELKSVNGLNIFIPYNYDINLVNYYTNLDWNKFNDLLFF